MGEGKDGEEMNAQVIVTKEQDAELQERVTLVIEDHARPAEQIINEQTMERGESDGTSTPRFLP
jgi:hypothetical protein